MYQKKKIHEFGMSYSLLFGKKIKILFYLVTNDHKSYTVLLWGPGQIYAVILFNSDI